MSNTFSFKRIKSIKQVMSSAPAYDVENVGGNHYFMLGNGVMAHNCLDEISAMTKQVDITENVDKGSFIRAFNLYKAVLVRMQSRFMQKGGIMPGKLFLISSRKSSQAFVDNYVDRVKKSENVFIVDDAIWNVKPKELYSGENFKVAVGNRFLESFVMKGDEEIPLLERQGYRILEVPVEYRKGFDDDIYGALRDFGGISVEGVKIGKLFPNDLKVDNVVKKFKMPFDIEGLEMGLDDHENIENFFDFKYLHKPGNQKFIHLDIGLRKDRLGIAQVSLEGINNKNLPIIYNDFAFYVKAKGGSEIPLNKVEQFIKWLRDSGDNIVKVTFDGFQSAYMIQNLILYKINTDRFSVDKDDRAYSVLKETIFDNRIIICSHQLLIRELKELEYDYLTKKVDHPDASGGGSKDISDCLAAATFQCCDFCADVGGSSGVSMDEIDEYNDLSYDDSDIESIKKGDWAYNKGGNFV